MFQGLLEFRLEVVLLVLLLVFGLLDWGKLRAGKTRSDNVVLLLIATFHDDLAVERFEVD